MSMKARTQRALPVNRAVLARN